MSVPVVEFVYYTASDAYKADNTIVYEPLTIVSKAAGSQTQFQGLQAEDGATLYVAVGWDSLKDHENLIADKVAYDPLVTSLQRAIAPSAQLHMIHVAFNNHSAAIQAMSDPATELAFFTLRSPAEADVLPGKMATLEKALETAPGRRSYTWGKVIEKDDQYLLIIGWDTVQAHWDALKVDQALAGAVASCRESVEIDLVHAILKEYKP